MERLKEHFTPGWTRVKALCIPVVEGVPGVGEAIA